MKADEPDDLRLNPKQFANLVVESHQVPDDKDPETIVKRKLTLYLTAYYLAERFNELQQTTLSYAPSRKNYQELLKSSKKNVSKTGRLIQNYAPVLVVCEYMNITPALSFSKDDS